MFIIDDIIKYVEEKDLIVRMYKVPHPALEPEDPQTDISSLS